MFPACSSLSVYLWFICILLLRVTNGRLLFEKVTVLENTRVNTAILDLREALIRHGEGPLPPNGTAYANQQEAFWPFILDNFVIKLARPLDREVVCFRQTSKVRSNQHLTRSSLIPYDLNSHQSNNQFAGNPDTACLPGACCQILHVIIMPSPTDVPKTVFIQVAVQDVNDNAPRFPQISSPYTTVIESIGRNERIWLPEAFDPDSSVFSVVRYQTINWKHGNQSHFQLNVAESGDILTSELAAEGHRATEDLLTLQNAGNIRFDSFLSNQGSSGKSSVKIRPYLTTTVPLDREKYDMYSFTLLAIDGGDRVPSEINGRNFALTGSVSIVLRISDVNDNRPVFSRPLYQVKLVENLMTSHVIDFNIHDNDIGDNGRITVSIHDPSGQAQRLFRVVLHPLAANKVASPLVSYAAQTSTPASHYKGFLQLLRQVDAERYPGLLRFNLVANDHGQPSLSSHVEVQVHIVNVNDNPPVIAFFNQGQRLSDNRLSLSEEKTPSRAIVSLVHVTDDDSPVGQIQCQIVEEAEFFLLEEAPSGGPGLSSMSRSQHSSFDHDLHSGSIVAGYRQFILRTRKSLDRETKSHHTVSISCTDADETQPLNRNASLHITVTDINDNSPAFDKSIYSGRIVENQAHAEVHLSSPLHVSDPDLGLNALLHFELLSAEPLSNSSESADVVVKAESQFRVDSRSGKIWSTVALDCEAQREYKLVLVVHDSGTPESRSSSATVLVTVDDVNDNVPVFSVSQYSFEIPENSPSGTEVGQVRAIDKDFMEVNQKVRYSIHGRPEDVLLMSIDRRSGVLRSRRPIDRESRSSISLVVVAENEVPVRLPHKVENSNIISASHRTVSVGPVSAEANVLITVLNLNDNPPEFRLREPYRTHITFIWEKLPVVETYAENKTSDASSDAKVTSSEEVKQVSAKTPTAQISETTGPACEPLVHQVSDKDVTAEQNYECCSLELLDDFNGLFILLPQAKHLLCATRRPSEPQTYKLTLIAKDGLTNDSHSSQTHFTVVIRSDPDSTSWLPGGEKGGVGGVPLAGRDRLPFPNGDADASSHNQQPQSDWQSANRDGESRWKQGLSPATQSASSVLSRTGYRDRSRDNSGAGQQTTTSGSHHTILVVFMATVAGLLCLLLLLSILLTKRCIIDMKPEFTKGEIVQQPQDSPMRVKNTVSMPSTPKMSMQGHCTLVPLSSPMDTEQPGIGYYPKEYLYQQPSCDRSGISQQHYNDGGTMNTTYSLAHISPGAANMATSGFLSPQTLVRQKCHRRPGGPVVFTSGPVLLPQTLVSRHQTLNNIRGDGAAGQSTELLALNKIEQAGNSLSVPASSGWLSNDNQAFQTSAGERLKGFCSLIPGDFERVDDLLTGSQYQTKCEAYNQSVYQTIDSKLVPSRQQGDANSAGVVTHDPTKVRFNEASQCHSHSGVSVSRGGNVKMEVNSSVHLAPDEEQGKTSCPKLQRNHSERGEYFQSSFV